MLRLGQPRSGGQCPNAPPGTGFPSKLLSHRANPAIIHRFEFRAWFYFFMLLKHDATASEPTSQKIARRARVITTFKEELIRRLNLPFTPEDLHEDISLLGSGLGLDSLDALEIILCIESCFKIKIPDENVAVLRSINTVVDFVIEQQERKGVTA